MFHLHHIFQIRLIEKKKDPFSFICNSNDAIKSYFLSNIKKKKKDDPCHSMFVTKMKKKKREVFFFSLSKMRGKLDLSPLCYTYDLAFSMWQ